MFKAGIRLVRSNRSNPDLKQGLAKARFCKKNTTPQIFSPPRLRLNRGGDCFCKTGCQPQCNGGADLKTSREKEQKVESVIESLSELEKSEDGKVFSVGLKLKYWAGIPYQ